jgi:cathepsin D
MTCTLLVSIVACGSSSVGLRTSFRRHILAQPRPTAAAVVGQQRQQQPPPSSVVNHLRNNPWCGYIATVSLGTPPQPFQVLMDTGSANLFVGAVGCKGCMEPLYKPAASSSYNRTGELAMVDWCEGALATDRLALSSTAAIQAVSFGACSKSSVLAPPSEPGVKPNGDAWYNGIFGLGMRALETQSAQIVPPLAVMKQQGLIPKELFSVYLDHKDEHAGEIHWGFIDESKFIGNLTWHPLQPEGEDAQPPSTRGAYVWYKVRTDSIQLGGSVLDTGGQIMTDTGA